MFIVTNNLTGDQTECGTLAEAMETVEYFDSLDMFIKDEWRLVALNEDLIEFATIEEK